MNRLVKKLYIYGINTASSAKNISLQTFPSLQLVRMCVSEVESIAYVRKLGIQVEPWEFADIMSRWIEISKLKKDLMNAVVQKEFETFKRMSPQEI